MGKYTMYVKNVSSLYIKEIKKVILTKVIFRLD